MSTFFQDKMPNIPLIILDSRGGCSGKQSSGRQVSWWMGGVLGRRGRSRRAGVGVSEDGRVARERGEVLSDDV